MMNLGQIQEAILREAKKIDELVDEIREAGQNAATAEVTYKVLFAKERAMARVDGEEAGKRVTVDMVEDAATEVTENERLAYLLATNNMTTCREALRAATARLDALRTLAASFRTAGG